MSLYTFQTNTSQGTYARCCRESAGSDNILTLLRLQVAISLFERRLDELFALETYNVIHTATDHDPSMP